MNILEDISPLIGRQKIYRLLGQQNSTVSGRLSRQIERCILQLENKIKPKVLFTTKKIQKIEDSTLALDGGVKLQSAKLSKTFKKCEKVTFYLATIGGQVDNVINASLKKKKLSNAYIYDAIASAAVEATVEEFQKRVDSTVKEENQSTTLRFSPGYCDWKIHDQKKLFSVLENDLIDVKLNERYLMAPRKSVSGVFGIGDSSVLDRGETNPCRLCSKHSCNARRINEKGF
jgi:hypothetical protein